MNIIFEDDYIIVAEKPYGLISQADSNGGDSLLKRLCLHTGNEVYPVHRLDKTTKGIMVYAKNRFSAASLSKQITEGNFSKIYNAAVHGKILPQDGKMEDFLFYDRKKGKSFIVKKERAGVKRAILGYKVLSYADLNGSDISNLEITLETGRTHQIRVQFASRGYPLLGDRRYGAKDGEKEIHLIARCLSFSHPKTGERMQFLYNSGGSYED